MTEDVISSLFTLHQGHLERSSEQSDPAVEDSTGNGFHRAKRETGQLGLPGVGISKAEDKGVAIFCVAYWPKKVQV